jgi:hypothetical protein
MCLHILLKLFIIKMLTNPFNASSVPCVLTDGIESALRRFANKHKELLNEITHWQLGRYKLWRTYFNVSEIFSHFGYDNFQGCKHNRMKFHTAHLFDIDVVKQMLSSRI